MLKIMHDVGDPTVPLLLMSLAGVAVASWLFIASRKRLQQIFERARGALDLLAAKPEASIRASLRAMAPYLWSPVYGRSSLRIGHGKRAEWTVELMLQLAGKASPETTTASVGGLPLAFEGSVLIVPSGGSSWLARQFSNTLVLGALGECIVYCQPPQALASLVPRSILDSLVEFPRELVRVEIDSRCVSISWRELETEPAIIERAFRIGIAVLIDHVARSPR